VRSDVISSQVFLLALMLWPLWLIVIGIEMIFKRTRLSALAYVSPVLMAAVFLLAGLEARDVERGSHGEGRFSYRYSQRIESEVDALKASIEIGDYDLLVRSRNDKRIRGRMTGWQRTPKMEYNVEGTQATLKSKPSSSIFSWSGRPIRGLIHINGHGLGEPEYRVDVPDEMPLELELNGDDCNAELNLAESSLKSLTAKLDDVSISLVVGEREPLIDVTLSGKGNRFRLNIPGSAGFKLDGDGIGRELTRYLERFGMTALGDGFVTPGYDTLTPQIKVTVNDELERFSLKTY
ncbi:MAG: hypothetical protein ACE5GA_08655, partial [Candidatus Zixiibacteriota bacterium]